MRTRTYLIIVVFVFVTSPLYAACLSGNAQLCLQEQRFQIAVEWKDFSGRTGKGTPVQITPDTGYFWFFDASNVELVVKILDGRPLNEHYWFFYGALSNVAYTITVTDTTNGEVKVYTNPSGHLASLADTFAFSAASKHGGFAATESKVSSLKDHSKIAASPVASFRSSSTLCTPTENTLCLNNGRFRLTSIWRDFQGNVGAGHAVSLSGDTGYFWFFSPSNVELITKALDGRPVNSSFWLFYGALSSVEYILEVTDTVTGVKKAYRNAPGNLASLADTSAFQDTTNAGLYASEAYDRFLSALSAEANLSSPEAANTFYAVVDPAKDILLCLKRAATSDAGAKCRGFDPQTASFQDVFVPPDQARRIASLLSLDVVSLENRSGEASSNHTNIAHPYITENQLQTCPYSAGATAAWYKTCKALQSNVLTVLEGVLAWGCLLGGPISPETCTAIVAAEIYVGMWKVIACSATPIYITNLFVMPTQEITLGLNDSKNFQIMGNFENRPGAGTMIALIKQTITAIFMQLHVPERLWAEALDPLADAVLERFGNNNINLAKASCLNPIPSYLATAEADIRSGGGVTVEGQTITSGNQEASGYIRPNLSPLAPWPYAPAESTAFKVEKEHCTGSGKRKLEYFYFPRSGGPSELSYTWHITHTTCDGSTLSHDSYDGKNSFYYPGYSAVGPNPVMRCDGKWHNFTISGSKPDCEWVPENPYSCTFTQRWKSIFQDGVLTEEFGESGIGYWRNFPEIKINSSDAQQYDLATGVFTIHSTSEWLYFSVPDECLDRILDLRETYTYALPIQSATCFMVDECPQ
jgi:hypothetical protein